MGVYPYLRCQQWYTLIITAGSIVWALRLAGAVYLGSVLWARGVPDTAWWGFGAFVLGALAVSLWERRGRTLAATGVALLFDSALVGALVWATGGAAFTYWLFVLPLVYALYRAGAVRRIRRGNLPHRRNGRGDASRVRRRRARQT